MTYFIFSTVTQIKINCKLCLYTNHGITPEDVTYVHSCYAAIGWTELQGVGRARWG